MNWMFINVYLCNKVLEGSNFVQKYLPWQSDSGYTAL